MQTVPTGCRGRAAASGPNTAAKFADHLGTRPAENTSTRLASIAAAIKTMSNLEL